MARQTAYTRVAEALRGAILDGHYRSGQRLPTESELCRDFATSRITVRQALRILEEEALVRRRQGLGTFVNSAATRRIPILNANFHDSVSRHAPDLERRLLEMDRVGAPEAVAHALDVCPGEPLRRAVRVDALRSRPVATDTAWFVARFSQRLTRRDLEALDLLECWRRRERIELHYGTQVIDMVKARPPVTTRLRVRSGDPLLREVNVVYLRGGRPVALFESFYRPAHFRFEATVSLRPHRDGRRSS
jgi:DNA-binding GntR family transcriptional regulator